MDHCSGIAAALNQKTIIDIAGYDMKHLDMESKQCEIGSPQFVIHELAETNFHFKSPGCGRTTILLHHMHSDFKIEIWECFMLFDKYYREVTSEALRIQKYDVKIGYFLLNFEVLWLRLSNNKSCRVHVKPGVLHFEEFSHEDIDEQNGTISCSCTTPSTFAAYMKKNNYILRLSDHHAYICLDYKKTNLALGFLINVGAAGCVSLNLVVNGKYDVNLPHVRRDVGGSIK